MSTVKKTENKTRKCAPGESIAPFAAKLYQILHNSEYESDICWNDKGDTVLILNTDAIQLNVLSRNFRDPRYPAFAKKLTAHGFQEVKVDDSRIGFTHPAFRKNCKAQLHKVKKIRGTKRGHKKRSKKALKNKNQAESLDPSNPFKVMAAKASQALLLSNLTESVKLISEMTSYLQSLESECGELFTLAKTQAEEIVTLEQKITEYRENYDTACAEIYNMIVARRNGAKGSHNLLMEKKPEKAITVNEASKLSIAVRERYKFGLNIATDVINSEAKTCQPTPTSVTSENIEYDRDIMVVREKLVKKDENAPNMFAIQKKSCEGTNLISYNQCEQNASTVMTNESLSSIYSDATNEKGEFKLDSFEDFEFGNANFLE